MTYIHHISTGGTIASDGSRMLGAESMMEYLNVHIENTEWSHEDADRIPSSMLTPTNFVQLSQRIHDASSNRQPDVILVTHGTDTMEESAFVTDMFLAENTPVIFTGSMRTGPYGDGPNNIQAAVRAGLDPSNKDRGVSVVMDQTIHAAIEVRKIHSTADDAFYSREPLGRIKNNTIHWRDWMPHRIQMPQTYPNHDVQVVRLFAGDSGDHIREAANQGTDGVIVEMFGAGNGSPDIFDAIESISRKGVTVCVTTRCGDGGIRLARECESVIALPYLDAPKARLALLFALSSKCLELLKTWSKLHTHNLY
ncbi:MAG: asparaginase [Phycisphaerales bacterium]|nr:asparaginase [Phycisphaerales bacterium]